MENSFKKSPKYRYSGNYKMIQKIKINGNGKKKSRRNNGQQLVFLSKSQFSVIEVIAFALYL